MEYLEEYNKVIDFLDTINIISIFNNHKHLSIQSIVDLIDESYDYSTEEASSIFDILNTEDFVNYVNERYPNKINISEHITVDYDIKLK